MALFMSFGAVLKASFEFRPKVEGFSGTQMKFKALEGYFKESL